MTKKPKKQNAKPSKASASKAVKKTSSAPAKPASAMTGVPEKSKRIRGSFSMPESDYALIGALKSASKKSGRVVKKNELLRAGLHALKAMTNEALQAALAALAPSKAIPRKKTA
jgi:hypothetical protein